MFASMNTLSLMKGLSRCKPTAEPQAAVEFSESFGFALFIAVRFVDKTFQFVCLKAICWPRCLPQPQDARFAPIPAKSKAQT